MIYLIDDNKYGQMAENYRVDFSSVLKSFSNQIKWLQTLSMKDISIVITNASCILIHDSFDAKEEKDKLIAMAKNKKIQYCIFSNGFTATLFVGDSIEKIKKDRFYYNLMFFINQFKADHRIDMKLLSLGQNYDAEKASIIQDRIINGTLLKNRNSFNYETAFPSGTSEYKDLMELVYLSDSSVDFSVFEEKYNSKETTAEIMRSIIVNMVKSVKQRYE